MTKVNPSSSLMLMIALGEKFIELTGVNYLRVRVYLITIFRDFSQKFRKIRSNGASFLIKLQAEEL